MDDAAVTVEWLREQGAFENKGEWVLSLKICGSIHQLRFQFDVFHAGQISEWYLLPSVGYGRVWLPNSTRDLRRFVPRECVLRLVEALGARVAVS